MSVKKAKIGRAFRLATLELAVFVLGMLFARREIWQFRADLFYIMHWQQGLLIPLSFIDGAITGAYASRRRYVQHWPAYRKQLRWANPTFFFLYVACCALCERLNAGQFTVVPEFWRTSGLLIVAFGMLVRVWADMSAPASLMRYPQPPEQPATAMMAGTAGDAPQAGELAAPNLVAQPQAVVAGEEALASSEDVAAATVEETAGAIEDSIVAEGAQLAGHGAHSEAAVLDPSSGNVAPPKPPRPTDHQDMTPVEPFAALAAPEPLAMHGEIFPAGPHKWLRHPDASGKLVALVGVSLAFNTWIPLLALPGVFVLLKWHIADLEAFRISQLGEPYLEYKRSTWNLIPFVY